MSVAFIPARMGSSRFPGKPLAKIHGVPMIGHCWFRSKMSKAVDEVYICTCDDEVRAYAESIGAPCIMTSASHERASDRVAEATLAVEARTGRPHDIVVMIQGDEPMLHPSMIDIAVKGLADDPAVDVVNLVAPLSSVEEFEDPNEVKVVIDQLGYALYFSREPIPSRRKGATKVPMLKQVCIIPFRRDFLMRYNDMEQTPLEIIESVDMMRILENGMKVRMVPTDLISKSVDTPADLRLVETLMSGDALMMEYT